MNIWHKINPKRITPDDFVAVIEIPKGSKNKYELDKETGLIPRTYADDNDPLDVLVLCSETLFPMTLVRCYPIGVIRMLDQGHRDDKIIAIPFDDPNYNSYTDIADLPPHIVEEMIHFFSVYKELEQKSTAVDEFGDAAAAREIIRSDIERYIECFCK